MKTHAKISPLEESTTLLETFGIHIKEGNKSIRQISPLGPDEKPHLMFSTISMKSCNWFCRNISYKIPSNYPLEKAGKLK